MNTKTAILIDRTFAYTQRFFGIISVIFGAIVILADLVVDQNAGLLIVGLLFLTLGILLIQNSRKTLTLINNFKKYVTVISNIPNGFIPDIAASLNTSENVVKKNLETMIHKKYFVNAYIDLSLNSIIIEKQHASNGSKQDSPKNSEIKTQAVEIKTQAVEMITAKCPGCGAINTIQKGSVGECDYCGSPITQS